MKPVHGGEGNAFLLSACVSLPNFVCCDFAIEMEIINKTLQNQNCSVVGLGNLPLAFTAIQAFKPKQISPTTSIVLGCEIGGEKAASYKHIVAIGSSWASNTATKKEFFFLQKLGKTRWPPPHWPTALLGPPVPPHFVAQELQQLHCLGSCGHKQSA